MAISAHIQRNLGNQRKRKNQMAFFQPCTLKMLAKVVETFSNGQKGQHCPAGLLITQSMEGNKNIGFFGLTCSLMVLTVANSALLHGTLEVRCLCVGTRSTSRRCRIAQSESKAEMPQASSSTFFKLSDFHQKLVSFYKCHFSSKSLDFAGYMTKMAC